MGIRIIVGANWGDEGKGRMVDYFAEQVDAVARYQGGNNAGHTVKNHLGEFKLHLMPSGVCCDGVTNILGHGMVIDIKALHEEWKTLVASGATSLLVSDRACIVVTRSRIRR